MLTVLALIAAAARHTHREYFTSLTVKHAAIVDAARVDGRRVGGVAVVHDHEQVTAECASTCTVVAAPPPMFGDPHR